MRHMQPSDMVPVLVSPVVQQHVDLFGFRIEHRRPPNEARDGFFFRLHAGNRDLAMLGSNINGKVPVAVTLALHLRRSTGGFVCFLREMMLMLLGLGADRGGESRTGC